MTWAAAVAALLAERRKTMAAAVALASAWTVALGQGRFRRRRTYAISFINFLATHAFILQIHAITTHTCYNYLRTHDHTACNLSLGAGLAPRPTFARNEASLAKSGICQ